MTGSITVYFNTGFNGIDIPADPTVLASATQKTYNDVYYIREDIDKPSIKIKDSYENLCAVDYCAITTTRGTSYFFASPAALSKGVTLLSLDLDALLTMGGAANLTYISGWQERGHIAKTDDKLFDNVAAEEWVPTQPLEAANALPLGLVTDATKPADILISNIALYELGDNADKQDVIEGIVTGSTNPVMYLPQIRIVDPLNETPFEIWDYTESLAHRFHLPNTGAFNPGNTTVRNGLKKLFSCGQLQLQGSYIIPQMYLAEDPIEGSTPSTAGRYGTIKGAHGSAAATTLPFAYPITGYTVKNKKVYATYRNYTIVNLGSGDLISKEPAEIYDGVATYPSVNIWADPCSTGKPYARFSYIKGNPIQYADCVRGLQWANSQIVMEGASGSMWNSINTAFQNQQLQRQQSANTFAASIAAQSADLAMEAANNALGYSAGGGIIGAIGNGIHTVTGALFGNKKVDKLSVGNAAASAGFGIANANLSAAAAIDANGYQLEALRNQAIAAGSQAEMANNSIQNEINQNNVGLLRSNRVVAPTISFTPEQNLGLYDYNRFVIYEVRKSDEDLKSEDMYYQRYGYNGLHRPLTAQCFNERTYYCYVQAFDVNLKGSQQFGLRVRTKAIAQLNKGVRVWKVLPDASYYETN